MQGLLLVNKPRGWSSFDVVAKTRSVIAKELNEKPSKIKVGHTGTLDPIAEGLLILLIGKKYTKLAAHLSKQDKEYKVAVLLGYSSVSFDTETDLREESKLIPTRIEVSDIINKFVGKIEQIPPIYSAIKVDGKRAYQLARNNQPVRLESRTVTIYRIDQLNYSYPKLGFNALVSSGTYIRSLVNDIGKALNTGAVMEGLTRISVGDYQLSEKVCSADQLDIKYIKQNLIELNIDSTLE